MKIRTEWVMGVLVMIVTMACAGEFSKQMTGSPGGWTGTIAGTVLDGNIYTVESAGSLVGAWTKIGGAR